LLGETNLKLIHISKHMGNYEVTFQVDVDEERASEISREGFNVDIGSELTEVEKEKLETVLDETVHTVLTMDCDSPDIVAHAIEYYVNFSRG
jgi:hypothetical protein